MEKSMQGAEQGYTHCILIADDSRAGRELLGTLLGDEGYCIAFASTGRETLEQVRALSPDVLLLDVIMPDMDGFEVCAALRTDPALADIPVIMVTSLDDRDSRLKGIEAGADDFISKPIDATELTLRMRTLTRLNRYRRRVAEQERFQWIMEEADDGYLVVDAEDTVLYANPRARQFLDMKEAGGHSFLKHVCGSYQCEPEEGWRTWPPKPVAVKGRPRYLVQGETDQSPPVWLEVAVLPQTHTGKAQWLLRLRDVTEHMTSRRATWTFHSMISHKLRTPLTGILSGASLITGESAREMDPEDLDLLVDGIRESARRLDAEVGRIFSYLDARALAGRGEGFRMAELAFCTDCIRVELGMWPVQVRLDPALESCQLTLSVPALETVLWGILDNARKFHPKQAPRVRMEAEASGPDEACLRITDDGRTLPPEQLQWIWRPYYQAERYHTGEQEGMGLGLSMVATLIWEVGGTCAMRNREDGPGVVVELRMPLAR